MGQIRIGFDWSVLIALEHLGFAFVLYLCVSYEIFFYLFNLSYLLRVDVVDKSPVELFYHWHNWELEQTDGSWLWLLQQLTLSVLALTPHLAGFSSLYWDGRDALLHIFKHKMGGSFNHTFYGYKEQTRQNMSPFDNEHHKICKGFHSLLCWRRCMTWY